MKPKSLPPILILLGWFFIILLSLILLYGCNAQKQIHKKDEQAIARVIANDSLLAKVAKRAGTKIIQSEKITIEHRYDTAITILTKPDTESNPDQLREFIDKLEWFTLTPYKKDLKNGAKVSIDRNGVIVSFPIEKKETYHTDLTLLSAQEDSTRKYQLLVEQLRGVILAKDDIIFKLQRDLATAQARVCPGIPFWIWLVIVILAIAAIIGFTIKSAIPWIAIIKLIPTFFKGIMGLFKKNKNKKDENT